MNYCIYETGGLSLGSHHDSGGLWILVTGTVIDEGGQAAAGSDLQPI